MTALLLADARETSDVAAFLARLLRWDKAAVVRLRAAGGVLAVFGHPPFGGVLAVRTAEFAEAAELDATVSAGQLLDGVSEADGAVAVPPAVTGPSWAGLLPPRGGWRRVAGLPPADSVRGAAAAVVAEFRTRTEALPPERRTRGELDALAEEIWSRTLGATGLPLRAVHAAHALGFLRGSRTPVPASVVRDAVVRDAVVRDAEVEYAAVRDAAVRDAEVEYAVVRDAAVEDDQLVLLAAGRWLRLRTPYGSVVVRRAGAPLGLLVSPA